MKDDAILTVLEEAADKLSIKLSYDDLKKGAVDTHGGAFKLKGEQRILIHKGLSVEEKIDVLTGILSSMDLESVHLPPEVRARVEASRND